MIQPDLHTCPFTRSCSADHNTCAYTDRSLKVSRVVWAFFCTLVTTVKAKNKQTINQAVSADICHHFIISGEQAINFILYNYIINTHLHLCLRFSIINPMMTLWPMNNVSFNNMNLFSLLDYGWDWGVCRPACPQPLCIVGSLGSEFILLQWSGTCDWKQPILQLNILICSVPFKMFLYRDVCG